MQHVDLSVRELLIKEPAVTNSMKTGISLGDLGTSVVGCLNTTCVEPICEVGEEIGECVCGPFKCVYKIFYP